jgi:predicted nucleic acid-binding protein
MILLDTHVISESLKVAGDARVLGWLDAQLIESLYVSTISLAELRFGIAALPAGKRKDTLHNSIQQCILPLFKGRLLPFDEAASETYGVLRARARAQGKAIATADGYIAATAIHHGLMVATRDFAPFEAAGLKVINPWEPPQ